jgi:flavodoxin
MSKVLIVYATRTGETQNIADLIAEGVRFAGHESTVASVKEVKNESDLDGYDGYVFGSSTYHGEMLQGMFLWVEWRSK